MKKVGIIILIVIIAFLAYKYLIQGGKAEQEADIPKMEEEKPVVETEAEAPPEAPAEEGLTLQQKMAMDQPVWGTIQRAKNPVVVVETNLGNIELELYWNCRDQSGEHRIGALLERDSQNSGEFCLSG